MTTVLAQLKGHSFNYNPALTFNTKGFATVAIDKGFQKIQLNIVITTLGRDKPVRYSKDYNKYSLGVQLSPEQCDDIAQWHSEFQKWALRNLKQYGKITFKPVVNENHRVWFNWPKTTSDFERITVCTQQGLQTLNPEELNNDPDFSAAAAQGHPINVYVEPYLYARKTAEGIEVGLSWHLREVGVVKSKYAVGY